MDQASRLLVPRSEEPLLPATLELVRRCPARPDYIELCFTTSEGRLEWCFPEPARRRRKAAGPLALTLGPYGVQAHRLHDGALGHALQSSSALPMILAGADVQVARRLVCSGR
ncbi:hypothetical protein ACRYCC_05540 [Actinomadura scrupuli]|uniref:hypothetical protein n=1 Tax=Actinomadura scrupuli TaxID=559629 RepID=UPI003D99E0E6